MSRGQIVLLAGVIVVASVALAFVLVDKESPGVSAPGPAPAIPPVAEPARAPQHRPVSALAATSGQADAESRDAAAAPVDISGVTKFPDVGQKFLQAVRAVPEEGGGLRVEAVEPNSLYGRLGLQPGDIVHNLDTIYLPTPEQKQQGIHPFNRPEIHLEVIRNGQPVLLTTPAEQSIN